MLCICKGYLSKKEERGGWKEEGKKKGNSSVDDDSTVRRMLVEGSEMATILMSCCYTCTILFNHSIQES